MPNSADARANSVFLLLLMLASALTMLWLWWRYPIPTSIMALIALIALGLSAHFAAAGETDGELVPATPEDGLGSH